MSLDAGNTAIVLDSTADFPEGPERFPNWRIVPLYVRFGTESLRDYVELDPDEFYRRLRTSSELCAFAFEIDFALVATTSCTCTSMTSRMINLCSSGSRTFG